MEGCSKCGGNTRLLEGISKKTNKPWKGYKCKDCGNMDFVKDHKPFGGFQGSNKPPSYGNNNMEILKMAVELASHTHDTKIQLIDEVLSYYKGLKFILAEQPEPKKVIEEIEGEI